MVFDHKSYRLLSWINILFLFITANHAYAQKILSREELIQSVLQVHPAIVSGQKRVDATSYERQTAFSLPNPSIGAQSPTGQFYAIGINQNFDFPSVYTSRKKMLDANHHLQQDVHSLQTQLLLLDACKAYQEGRFRASELEILREQDSLLNAIYLTAERRFNAGDIDFMEKSFAMLEYGQIHQQYLLAMAAYQNSLRTIQYYMSSVDSFILNPFAVSEFTAGEPDKLLVAAGSPYIEVAQGELQLIESQLKVEKNKALPGIQLGYLNQAGKDTPVNMRWQAGITIPLWFWQYSGNIKAMKARQEAYSANVSQTQTIWETERKNAIARWNASKVSLQYHIENGLPVARQLADASTRYLTQGETNYTTHLRTLKDVLQYKMDYAEAAYQYALATEDLNYYNNNIQGRP